MGYVDVGVEEFVHEQKFAGSVVLYRLNRGYGDGTDREHRFVTSGEELVRLRKPGWTYDGSKGFVSPVP